MSTATETVAYDCPSWCERPDHAADDLSTGDAPYHYGPTFGAFIGVMAPGTEQPMATLDDENRDDLTAGELRQLAAERLWLRLSGSRLGHEHYDWRRADQHQAAD